MRQSLVPRKTHEAFRDPFQNNFRTAWENGAIKTLVHCVRLSIMRVVTGILVPDGNMLTS
jgi:hypothetical protein